MSSSLNSTVGFQAVSHYLESCFTLDLERFKSLLAENVELCHTNNQAHAVIGRDKVMEVYKELFFDVTSNFDIQEITIRSNELQPEFFCRVVEDKKWANQPPYRAEINDHTILHLTKEQGTWKIAKIVAHVSLKILSETAKT